MFNNQSDDMIDAFFNFDSNVKFAAPKPQFQVNIKTEVKEEIDHKREAKPYDYVDKYRIKEENLLLNQTFNMPTTSSAHKDSGEDSDDSSLAEIKKEDPDLPELDVFQRYSFNLNPQVLPILKKRETILSMIDRNKVVILTSATGTGKSSQVPQYLLERAFQKGENCNIIVTQPRRIAAISIAKRVAMERKCECGTLVGYQIGLDRQLDTQINSDTRILFCTTGVLVQRLINEKTMKRYTHVILDEVHERDIDMDMLLIIVRRLLATLNPYVKIILMSATLNAEKIADFFKVCDSRGNKGPCPILDLNIPRRFPINFTFLDSLEHLGASREIVKMESLGISDEMYKVGVNTIGLVLQKIAPQLSPSFLVFLPGIQEIYRFKRELLKPNKAFNISEFHLVILHSSISSEECAKAFDPSVDRKIILATNIAESSITLSVRFVIDFCLTKYQTTDTPLKMTQLKLDWASRMSLEQRAGRVGRVELGQVIRLIYQDQYLGLPKETVPEMMRASLEHVVLKSKRLEMGKPLSVLALALDPPPKSSIDDAVLVLKEIGGLTKYSKRGKFDVNDGEMTFAGNIMAKLPVDVRVSKLIIMGYMFSCLEECIIIGAGLSSKTIFKTNLVKNTQKMEGYHQKLKQAKGSASDFIAIYNAYSSWRQVVNSGLDGRREKIWCDHQMLERNNLRDMHDLVEDIKNRLQFLRISIGDVEHQFNQEEKVFVLKICIAGAFYPNYFTFGGKQPAHDEYHVINNMNPNNTVYLKEMLPHRIGPIYEKQVRENLVENEVTEELNEMKVTFDSNSTRLFVNFKRLNTIEEIMVPGEVCLEVYKALKLGKLEKKMKIRIMSPSDEQRYVLQLQLGSYIKGKFEFRRKFLKASLCSIYPNASAERIPGKISHIVNCSKFYFQPNNGLANIEKQREIIQGHCKPISNDHKLFVGTRVIIKNDGLFKRGQIIEESDEDDPHYFVYLRDYGEVLPVLRENFFTLNNEIFERVFELPPQCFECRLCEIVPSGINCPSGWSEQATEEFKNFIANRRIEIDVYSFIDRIASVRVIVTGQLDSLNNNLVQIGLAQKSDEPYSSMINHLDRDSSEELKPKKVEDEMADHCIESPPELYLTRELELDGPLSPLSAGSCLTSLFRARPNETSIDASSVNAILLDPFPNDGIKKVFVAASMSKNDNQVILNHTMIMPNLPGMACLLGLLFSPTAQVLTSIDRTRYTSILTGLGCDQKRKSHYGEHDSLIYVDCTLSKQDIHTVNEIRSYMSMLMQNEPNFKQQNFRNNTNKNARHDIILQLRKLAKTARTPLGLIMQPNEWDWMFDTMKPTERVYPELKVGKLVEMSEEARRNLKRHAEELERKAATNTRNESLECRLCEERIENVQELKLHVMKRLHKENFANICNGPTFVNEGPHLG